jgi:hypothetical protein
VVRAEVRQEDLADELRIIEARGAEDDSAKRRAEAEAAVAAVIAKVAEHYTKPAETIAAFLAEWQEADRLAREARVPGPDRAQRQPAGTRDPDREVPFTAYIDENGNATEYPHRHRADGTIDRTKVRAQRTFYRTEPGATHLPRRLPPLAPLVNLPRYDEPGEHHRGDRAGRGNRWE